MGARYISAYSMRALGSFLLKTPGPEDMGMQLTVYLILARHLLIPGKTKPTYKGIVILIH